MEKNAPGFGRATFLFGHDRGTMDGPMVAAATDTLGVVGVFVALVLLLLAMFKAEWISLA